MPQLAIAWILKNTNVSTVILGVSSMEQLEENIKAVEIKDKMSEQIYNQINEILGDPKYMQE